MKHTVYEVVLKNDARGLIVDVPGAQVMSNQIHFRAGYRFARDSAIYETAHIMEHMAFGASKSFKDAHAYESEFTKNGAYHNAYTNDISMVYEAECAQFEWERVLELQRAAITTPLFREEEFISERGNVKGELTGYLNVPNRLLWLKVAQELGEDVLTYPERLSMMNDITVADVRDHYKRTHTAGNMRFVIAGDFTNKKAKLESMLEDWQLGTGERLPIPVDELHSAPAFLIRRKDAPNLTFGWSLTVPRRLSDAADDAMSCLNHILTGTLRSRILGEARKQGVVYSMFSDTSTNEHNSTWDFGAQSNIEDVEKVVTIMAHELKRIIDGDLDETEIEDAKSYALGRYQMSAQTVGQINHFYASRYFFDGKIENFDTQPSQIQAVTKDRIIETAREFFATNCQTFGAYGNTDTQFIRDLAKPLSDLCQPGKSE